MFTLTNISSTFVSLVEEIFVKGAIVNQWFDGLHDTINDVQANRVTIARSILYFTQFISESLRISDVQNWVVANFANENALSIPRFILAFEHGWGRAGYRLNNPGRNSPILSLGISGVGPNFLSLEDMSDAFLITLRKTARPSREPMSMFGQYMDTVYVLEGTLQRRFRDRHGHRATSGASTSRQSGDGAGPEIGRWDKGKGVWRWN
ncbi:hypothetical protein POM88_046934 [Heracleum sosnowskyi]|uniref:Uncharacterized protein n=1 Tax=Heracleum sosnowskyi TaxID=360622 RepID=A0AAD8M541_9APIA|nr:hypothetical protein POM88_046934 [Heracleum sosnowskyi]